MQLDDDLDYETIPEDGIANPRENPPFLHAQYSEVVQLMFESWSADPGRGFFPIVLLSLITPLAR